MLLHGYEKDDFFIHFDGLYANKAAVRGNSTAG